MDKIQKITNKKIHFSGDKNITAAEINDQTHKQ